MKRTLSLLLLIVVLVYAKQGYNLYIANQQSTTPLKGTLSDITEEVLAIPLKPTGDTPIVHARNIKQEGNDLFLISNNVLYRFTRDGEFVCRITNPVDIRVAGYVLNQGKQEVIVLGNENDIFYYTYEGVLTHQKKLKSNIEAHRIQSLTMINNQIWTVEEDVETDEETMETVVRKRVVSYNSSFDQLHSQVLEPVEVGRSRLMAATHAPLLCVDSDTGQVYVYASNMSSEHLLRDTLHLLGTWRRQFGNFKETNTVPLCPIRMGSRFWISSYANRVDLENSYTFCYDTMKRSYCEVKGGLQDDMFHTGQVPDLEAMDAFNQTYAFCRSGEVIKKAFPDRKADENAVVFILKLKA